MKISRIVAWLGVALLSFSVGFVSDISDNFFEISKNLDIFGRLYREVNTLYVEETEPGELMRTGIDAMLASLDPYTNYIPEEEVEDFRFISTGAYAGVGALIGKQAGKIVILSAYADEPADQAGLRAGDELLQVDDIPIDGKRMKTLEVRNMLRGEKGESVRLQVRRMGEASPIAITIVRDRIKVDNVPYYGMLPNRIGYINLAGFTEDAGKEVERALKQLDEQSSGLQGVVLDLRGNPGGRLDEAVKVTNLFVGQKEIVVETKGRIEGSQHTHRAPRKPVAPALPLAVLIDGGSASASEIVAGAIQDLDRGMIVGRRSFGKGLVQNIRPLVYKTQLKITTAKYYTPSGRCIQAINYGERDAKGDVSRIPDSLRSTFYTRNGRPVRDGGGIGPDLTVEPEAQTRLANTLSREGILFAFANQYVAEHPSLASPADFAVDDALYQAFVDFARAQDYAYQTAADQELAQLRAVVEEEAYSDLLESELSALAEKLSAEKDADLLRQRQPISRLLERELVSRYYYEAGAIEASLNDDPDVREAIQALLDDSSYRSTLRGPGE